MLYLIQYIELSQSPSQLRIVDRKAYGHSETVEVQITYDCAVEDINNAQLTRTYIKHHRNVNDNAIHKRSSDAGPYSTAK
jgi:hypothetical protein